MVSSDTCSSLQKILVSEELDILCCDQVQQIINKSINLLILHILHYGYHITIASSMASSSYIRKAIIIISLEVSYDWKSKDNNRGNSTAEDRKFWCFIFIWRKYFKGENSSGLYSCKLS